MLNTLNRYMSPPKLVVGAKVKLPWVGKGGETKYWNALITKDRPLSSRNKGKRQLILYV